MWMTDNSSTRHRMMCLSDSLYLYTNAKLGALKLYNFTIEQAVGSDRIAIRTGITNDAIRYWDAETDGSINTELTEVTEYPFRLIPVDPALGIEEITLLPKSEAHNRIYDLQGHPINPLQATKGIYIINGKKVILQ